MNAKLIIGASALALALVACGGEKKPEAATNVASKPASSETMAPAAPPAQDSSTAAPATPAAPASDQSTEKK